MENSKLKKCNKLDGNIYFKITTLAIPSIISMLIVALYSVCDGYFLSCLGEVACGGVCYPAVAIMQGVVMTFAFGSANKLSASVGGGDAESAKCYYFSGLVGVFLACILTGGLVGLFADKITTFCGGENFPNSQIYLAVQGYTLVIFGVYFYFSAILRSQGRAGVVLVASVVGLLCNFVLDYAVVNFLSLGVFGIAISTCGSQLVAGAILVLAQKSSTISTLDFGYFSFKKLQGIIFLGSSSFFRQLMGGISGITLNLVCVKLAPNLLAGCTVASKISVLLFSFGLGLGQGMQPVVAYHFGKNNTRNATNSLIFTALLGVVFGVLIGVLQFNFAGEISRLFGGENPQSVGVAKQILQFSAFSLPFSYALVIINMAFQGVGKKLLNATLSTLRQGVVYIPVLLTFSWLFSETGVIISHFTADIIAGTIGLFLCVKFWKFPSQQTQTLYQNKDKL